MEPKLTPIRGGLQIRLEGLEREWSPAAGRKGVEFELTDAEVEKLLRKMAGYVPDYLFGVGRMRDEPRGENQGPALPAGDDAVRDGADAVVEGQDPG